MEIILATHNLDKCKELQESLKSPNIKILTLADFPEIGEKFSNYPLPLVF